MVPRSRGTHSSVDPANWLSTWTSSVNKTKFQRDDEPGIKSKRSPAPNWQWSSSAHNKTSQTLFIICAIATNYTTNRWSRPFVFPQGSRRRTFRKKIKPRIPQCCCGGQTENVADTFLFVQKSSLFLKTFNDIILCTKNIESLNVVTSLNCRLMMLDILNLDCTVVENKRGAGLGSQRPHAPLSPSLDYSSFVFYHLISAFLLSFYNFLF